MYAIIETGGKQYKVSEGDTIFVEKLEVEDGASYTFDKVLAVADGDKVTFGAPVSASVVKTGKSKKIYVFKMKSKKNYRRKKGHRQPYTKLTIEKINA